MSTIVYLNWLFHDAVANAGSTSSDVRLINERGISKYLEGSGRSLRRNAAGIFVEELGTSTIIPRIERGTFHMEEYSVTSGYQQVGLWHMAVIPFKHI